MKKHNEGYVLAFVLIVVAVLALISTAVSTVAVRNMESQQAAVKRMQDKYEAEGVIEKIVAELSNIEVFEATDVKTEFDEKLTEICGRYPTTETGKLTKSVQPEWDGSSVLTCTLTIESANDSSLIKTDIKLESEVSRINDKYTVEKPVLTYISYKTTAQTTEPSEGGAAE